MAAALGTGAADRLLFRLAAAMVVRVDIYQGLKRWELMAVVAGKLTEWNPGEPDHFISLAYAVRRAESIHAAQAILKRAEGLLPRNATIQFNLACYEMQVGNLARAKVNLEMATRDP